MKQESLDLSYQNLSTLSLQGPATCGQFQEHFTNLIYRHGSTNTNANTNANANTNTYTKPTAKANAS